MNEQVHISGLQDCKESWSSTSVDWADRLLTTQLVVSHLDIPFVISEPLFNESNNEDRALASLSLPEVTGAGAATGGGGGGAPPGGGGAGAPP